MMLTWKSYQASAWDPTFLPQGRAPIGGVKIRDPVSEGTPKLHGYDSKLLLIKNLDPPSQPDNDIQIRSKHFLLSDPCKGACGFGWTRPGPMKGDQTRTDLEKITVSLAGTITMSTLDEEFLATAYPKIHENLKLITDERVFEDKPESHSGSMSSMKNLDDTFNFGDQFLHDKPTEDDQEKSKSVSILLKPVTTGNSSYQSTSKLQLITTSLPLKSPPFIALCKSGKLVEQEMSEVKKTHLSADVLASIRSQVPTAVDNYLGTKLDDALLKVLERHTADLIEKYSVLPGPESVKNQESEKSPKEIIKAKKEQDEEKQEEKRFKLLP
ncbi:hypothetical protein Tco_0861765 [Tanacetum coccineum]